MKLLRYGPVGHEKPGLLDAEGILRDLSGLIDDITPHTLAPARLAALAALDPTRLPRVEGRPRLGVPWNGTPKYVAIGLNYHDHAVESNMPVPTEPVIFPKWTSCLCGPDDDILHPPESTQMDWEVELGIVIGSRARHVAEADALDHVAGYVLANDVSARDWQLQRSGGQWGKGKGFDTFGPVGPWLATKDEIPDPQQLDLWLDVNGERKQTGTTRLMIFSCAQVVAYLSRIMTLEPGDLVITGTPPGVGMGMKPPQFLQVGDLVELGISGLGSQRQRIVAGR
ncbi:fumarylacetoacetate hydrolase family protein [Zoogloea sp.]|uniref:fumarylacetoacetate hydrolase family protein n=1 Tax=Zoogloea sp. TaxID=49181 RepID=UPI0035B1A043